MGAFFGADLGPAAEEVVGLMGVVDRDRGVGGAHVAEFIPELHIVGAADVAGRGIVDLDSGETAELGDFVGAEPAPVGVGEEAEAARLVDGVDGLLHRDAAGGLEFADRGVEILGHVDGEQMAAGDASAGGVEFDAAEGEHAVGVDFGHVVDLEVVGHAEDVVAFVGVDLHHLVGRVLAVAGGGVGVEIGAVGVEFFAEEIDHFCTSFVVGCAGTGAAGSAALGLE